MLDRLQAEASLPVLSSSGRRLSIVIGILTCLAGTSVGWAQQAGLEDLMDEMFDEFADQAGDDFDEFATEGKAGSEEPVDLSYLEDKVRVNEYDIVDLHVNNEDLGNVLQLLSLQSQRNIVASNNVSATVTADLYNVTFEEALDAILHVNGYGWVAKGNFIYVYTAEELVEIEQASRVRVTRMITLDYLSAADAAAFVQPLLSPEGKITANSQTGPFSIGANTPVGADEYALNATLVVFDYEENVQAIMDLIEMLDTKPVQVLVEATILQTSLNENNAFGVDFSLLNNMDFEDFVGSGPLGVVDTLITGVGATMVGGATTETTVPIRGNGSALNTSVGKVGDAGGLKAGIVNEDVAVFLRLLDEVTDVTVVSNPKILTLNRQPARVLVGTKVGYLSSTSTETSTTQTVEFLDTGTQLNLRPFVSADGLIRMELKPQVSSFRLRNVTDANSATVTIPDEDTSELVTNVMVRDGQTIVLGGLFTETTTANRRQVPGLGDLPVVGAAFRGHDDETRRSEIIFMITPSIVNDTQLAETGARAEDYVSGARTGSRMGTLPWGRQRQVGRLLIEARAAAAAGDRETALYKVRRALAKHPQNTEARRMLDQLTTTKEWPSGSMLEDIFNHELDLPTSSARFDGTTPDFSSSTGVSFESGTTTSVNTDWLLADDFAPGDEPTESTSASSAFNDAWTDATPGEDGFVDLHPEELMLRQQSTQVFGPDAVWLPDEARWQTETGQTAQSNEESILTPADESSASADATPSTEAATASFDASIFDDIEQADGQSPLFDEFAVVPDDFSDDPSSSIASGEITADSTDFNNWAANSFVNSDEVPVFFPVHGGLVWIALPRGMFSIEDLSETFSDEAVTNVPTDEEN
ncbi:MAG: hypothetical protein D6695_01060 [Planctomycetota bacterium]|nr:MAG: hypothetical protein D6695_01060 [Planctomycetota bacterium]